MYDRTILSTIEYHHSMLTDEVCMRSYLQAVLKAVKPGDVVLDIGSGTGILAYFACMAGARRVYAIEQDPLVGLAETISRHNGFDDRIVFVNDWSDHVELPELADVLLTETIGNMMEYAESAVDERMTYTANVRIEDPDGTLLYITKTAQPVIVQGEVVDPIRILVEPV